MQAHWERKLTYKICVLLLASVWQYGRQRHDIKAMWWLATSAAAFHRRESTPSSRLPWCKSVTVEQASRESSDASVSNGEEGETPSEKRRRASTKEKKALVIDSLCFLAPGPPLSVCFWPCVSGPKGRAWAPPPRGGQRGTAGSAVCLRLGRWIYRWWSSPTTNLTSLPAIDSFFKGLLQELQRP